jgi:hypothetical protein
MKKIKIIIIDDNAERAKELERQMGKHIVKTGSCSIVRRAEVFINAADDRRIGKYDLGDKNKRKNQWQKEWEEDLVGVREFDLIFLHLGENKFNNKFYKPGCEAKGITNRVIGYTGGRCPYWYDNSNYLENIGRGEDVAGTFRFKAFFEDWFYNEAQNNEQFGVPWNFRKLTGHVLEYLPVISILCQGYLGAYTASGDYKSSKVVETALEKMGWYQLKDLQPGQPANDSEPIARRAVKSFDQTFSKVWPPAGPPEVSEAIGNPAWFKAFFEKEGMEKDTLIEEIKNEWGEDRPGDLEKIIILINAIYDIGSPGYNPAAAAGAYLAAAAKIGG